MKERKKYTEEFKIKVLDDVKNSGKTIAQIARDNDISDKNIYNWLNSKLNTNKDILKIKKLEREKEELLTLIGNMALNFDREKKEKLHYKLKAYEDTS